QVSSSTINQCLPLSALCSTGGQCCSGTCEQACNQDEEQSSTTITTSTLAAATTTTTVVAEVSTTTVPQAGQVSSSTINQCLPLAALCSTGGQCCSGKCEQACNQDEEQNALCITILLVAEVSTTTVPQT
ncbi:unnamed protein product, partial [Didymodactylos carnosus]